MASSTQSVTDKAIFDICAWKSPKISCNEAAYVTIENPAFCLALYLTAVHFGDVLQHVCDVSEQ